MWYIQNIICRLYFICYIYIDDCSNIQQLTFDIRESFSLPKTKKLLLLKQFALKFINLKQLKLYFRAKCNSSILLFWKFLKPIIETNNTFIELRISNVLFKNIFPKLNNTISEAKLSVDKIDFAYLKSIWNSQFKCIKTIIESDNSNLQYFKFNCGKGIESLSQIIKYISNNTLLFKSLYVIEFEGQGHSSLQLINDILAMKIIIDKKLFIILNFTIDCNNAKMKDNFYFLLKQLYKNIKLLINEQIAINIKLRFDKCNSVFIHCQLNQENLLKIYKEPKCNKMVCLSLMKPQISLTRLPKDSRDCVLNVVNCTNNT